jgi:hypothetical protein
MRYCVNILKDGQWSFWADYRTQVEAERAARGLVEGGKAAQCHVLEIREDGGKIVATIPQPDGAEAVIEKEKSR